MSRHQRRASPGLRLTAATDSALSQLRNDLGSNENAVQDGPPVPLTARALATLGVRRSDPIMTAREWTQSIELLDVADAVEDIVPIEVKVDGGGADRPSPKRTEE